MNEQDVSQIVLRTMDLMNSRSIKEFQVPPDTYIGGGAITRIGEAVAVRGIRNAFIVVDEVVETLGLAEGMYRSLAYSGVNYCECKPPAGEPQSRVVEEEAARFAASNCDGMIAIGGGSAMDAAKAIAVLAANPGLKVADLKDPANIRNRRAPLIAVPTTAGTGSEATSVTVISDSATHLKQVIGHPSLVPDLAIIDACLMLRVPPGVTAATGVDAMVHSIESYVATRATPLTRALAFQALRQIGEALPIAVGRGDNVEARESMALASYMAGVAFSNSGLGLTHSMAHQIGPKYNLPHGMANAILIPSVMAFNALVCKRGYSDIGLALTGQIMPPEAAIAAVQRLIVDLGLPGKLSEVGGKAEDFEAFAEAALQDYCLPTNPRTVNKKQIIQVYQHALDR